MLQYDLVRTVYTRSTQSQLNEQGLSLEPAAFGFFNCFITQLVSEGQSVEINYQNILETDQDMELILGYLRTFESGQYMRRSQLPCACMLPCCHATMLPCACCTSHHHTHFT